MKRPIRRMAVVAACTVAILCLWPAIAFASVVADWEMTDVGHPPATMTDTSGHGHDGTPSGGVVGDGSIFTFDGTGIVVVPDDGTLDPDAADVTITAAISFSRKPNGDYDIVRKKAAGVSGPQYRMEINKYGKAKCFFTGDRGNASIAATPILSDGQLHTIVCTKTASTIGVRVDGGTLKSKGVTIGSIANGYLISVGGKADCSNACNPDSFVGSIDSVILSYG
jgi:hypothetical protein